LILKCFPSGNSGSLNLISFEKVRDMLGPRKSIARIVSEVKEAWSVSPNVKVSTVSSRIPDRFKKTVALNSPPLDNTFPEYESLMCLEWRKSTELQLQKDPSLESKRFCTIVNFADFKMGFLYLGSNTNYPRHAHTPEEIYHVVDGNCLRLCKPGKQTKVADNGDIWVHESEEAHGLQTPNSPVLIAWAWWGNMGGCYYFCDTPEEKSDYSYVYK
jgi:hypothetical protein